MYSFAKRISPGEYHQMLLRMESIVPSLSEEKSKTFSSMLERLYAVETQRTSDTHKIVLRGPLKTDFTTATEIYHEYLQQQKILANRKASSVVQ